MNQTEENIKNAVSSTIVQEKKLEKIKDERAKEQEIQKATDELEDKVEELIDKQSSIDYETGKVIGGDDVAKKEKDVEEGGDKEEDERVRQWSVVR